MKFNKILVYRLNANVLVNIFVIALLLGGLVLSPHIFASPDSPGTQYQNELLQTIRQEHLGESLGWRKLLLIPDYKYPSQRSIVDDPHFFFSPEGKSHPELEIEATLKAFFLPLDQRWQDQVYHPQCMFPARYRWLNQHLKFDPQKLPAHPCPELTQFKEMANYYKLSLVFSNYYTNNPASMFGHTFFRLHRHATDKGDAGLLDDMLNFSAFVDDMGSILYPIKGLSGMYPGRFTLMPYYRKLQEYSNYESRDLWEYDLNLSKDQLDLLVDLMWELGFIKIDYFYLDDNCSFVMLTLLEAVAPDYKLTRNFNLYSIPGDTLRAAIDATGLAGPSVYRPSALTRFLYRYEDLSGPEKNQLRNIIDQNDLTVLSRDSQCNSACQARLLDATLEFIDYKEKIAGMNEATTYKTLRFAALKQRAHIPLKPQPTENRRPLSEKPDEGHPSSWIAVAGGQRNHENYFGTLHWRPALHDLAAASDRGYASGTQVGFLDTTINFDSEHSQGQIDRLTLLEVLSLPPEIPLVDNWSWRFKIGFDRFQPYHDSNRKIRHSSILGAMGKSWYPSTTLTTFALFEADLGYQKIENAGLGRMGTLALAGILYKFNDKVKMTFLGEGGRYWGHKFDDTLETKATIAWLSSPLWENRMAVTTRSRHKIDYSIEIGRYF